MLPLEGITVLALEQAVAVPFATRQLADLGARVIKVERLGGGDFARDYDATVHGLSSHFVWLNRSKESLTLDLKQPEAKRILCRILETADVFIHNLAPGAVDRLGFDSASVRAAHPRLITCAITGYGSSGPYREKKAYDLLVQCEAGLVSVTGTPDTPSKVGISVADIAAGMYAYSGVLTALYQRERTGMGSAFEVSLFEALGEWMSYPAYFEAYGGIAPARSGASHATIAPYGPFPTGDGQTVFLGLQNEREWQRFCDLVLRQPDLATDPRFRTNADRAANVGDLRAIITEAFRPISGGQVVARLDEAQIANARLNSPRAFWEHPQLQARDRWREVESPAGPLRAMIPPVTMEGVEPRMDPIPDVGEQTEIILRGLGYDDAAIRDLRASAVI